MALRVEGSNPFSHPVDKAISDKDLWLFLSRSAGRRGGLPGEEFQKSPLLGRDDRIRQTGRKPQDHFVVFSPMDASRDRSGNVVAKLDRRIKRVGPIEKCGVMRNDAGACLGQLDNLEFRGTDYQARTLRHRKLNAKVVSAL